LVIGGSQITKATQFGLTKRPRLLSHHLPTGSHYSHHLTQPQGAKGIAMFMFEVGKEYKTQNGATVKALGRTTLFGYECLLCSDDICRYDRSTSNLDAGRATGTAHDYSDGHNFVRDDAATGSDT